MRALWGLIASLRTDLVSVGSYRTNISMSDFESVKEYGANDNACMKASQETQLGGDGTVLAHGLPPASGLTEPPEHHALMSPLSVCAEFITTTASVESAAETKKAKRVRGRSAPTDLAGTSTAPALAASPEELPTPLDLIYQGGSPSCLDQATCLHGAP